MKETVFSWGVHAYLETEIFFSTTNHILVGLKQDIPDFTDGLLLSNDGDIIALHIIRGHVDPDVVLGVEGVDVGVVASRDEGVENLGH